MPRLEFCVLSDDIWLCNVYSVHKVYTRQRKLIADLNGTPRPLYSFPQQPKQSALLRHFPTRTRSQSLDLVNFAMESDPEPSELSMYIYMCTENCVLARICKRLWSRGIDSARLGSGLLTRSTKTGFGVPSLNTGDLASTRWTKQGDWQKLCVTRVYGTSWVSSCWEPS